MNDEKFLCNLLEVLREGGPRLVELGLRSITFIIIIHIMMVLPHHVELVLADAGNYDGIDAMMGMAVARLLLVLILYAPHLTELRGDGSLDAEDLTAVGVECVVEITFQVEGRIFGNQSDACTLAACKAFGNFRHGKSVILAFPVFQFLHVEILPSYSFVSSCFVTFIAFLITIYLFSQLFNALLPRFNSRHYELMISQFCRQLGLLDLPVISAAAKRHVHLRAVAACTSRDGMFYVVSRAGSDEVGNTYLVACIKTDVTLLFPQLILQDVGFCRLDVFAFRFYIELTYLLCILLVLPVLFSLQFIDGCTHVGIVQGSGIFDVNFCVWPNLAFFDKVVNDLAHFVQRAHSHGVLHGIRARAAK